MVDHFVKVFLDARISIYITSIGFNTWWSIQENKLYLNRHYITISPPKRLSISFSASHVRIDKSKELIDLLKDDKW